MESHSRDQDVSAIGRIVDRVLGRFAEYEGALPDAPAIGHDLRVLLLAGVLESFAMQAVSPTGEVLRTWWGIGTADGMHDCEPVEVPAAYTMRGCMWRVVAYLRDGTLEHCRNLLLLRWSPTPGAEPAGRVPGVVRTPVRTSVRTLPLRNRDGEVLLRDGRTARLPRAEGRGLPAGTTMTCLLTRTRRTGELLAVRVAPDRGRPRPPVGWTPCHGDFPQRWPPPYSLATAEDGGRPTGTSWPRRLWRRGTALADNVLTSLLSQWVEPYVVACLVLVGLAVIEVIRGLLS